MTPVLFSILLATAASPALASPSCPTDQIEAVEMIIRHETHLKSSQSILSAGAQGRGETRYYFSSNGHEYSHERGERRIPDGFLPTGGLSYRWDAYEKETWHRGDEIYRISRDAKGQHNRRTRAMSKPHNPQVAIESVKPGSHTSKVAGFNCRTAEKTLPDGATITACNLEIYGRNTPLEWQVVHMNGSRQSKQVLSLQRKCVEPSLFKVPELDWK